MDEVTIGIAFIAGIFSFLSPCVLPLVPGYISYISGISLEELEKGEGHKKVLLRSGFLSVFFVLGFSVVFIAMGASASAIGKLLARHMHLFMRIAGIIIFILGLHLTGIFRIPVLNYQKKISVEKVKPGFFGAFVVGLAFAFGWTPCIGPILGGILTMAAAEKTMARGVILLLCYSLGLGIPFIITGFAIGVFMRFFEKYKKFIRWGEVIAGVLLIALGVLIFFDKLRMVPTLFSSIAS